MKVSVATVFQSSARQQSFVLVSATTRMNRSMDGLDLPTEVGCKFFLLSSNNVLGVGRQLVGGIDSSVDLSRSTAMSGFPRMALLARLAAAAAAVTGFDDACVVVDAHL